MYKIACRHVYSSIKKHATTICGTFKQLSVPQTPFTRESERGITWAAIRRLCRLHRGQALMNSRGRHGSSRDQVPSIPLCSFHSRRPVAGLVAVQRASKRASDWALLVEYMDPARQRRSSSKPCLLCAILLRRLWRTPWRWSYRHARPNMGCTGDTPQIRLMLRARRRLRCATRVIPNGCVRSDSSSSCGCRYTGCIRDIQGFPWKQH